MLLQIRWPLECFFNTLDDEELGVCWFYEYLREFVLRMPSRHTSDYFERIKRLRELVHGQTPEEGRHILMEQQHEPLPAFIPVLFEPEWPDTPYQAILPKAQRVKRLPPVFLPNSSECLLGNLWPFRMPDEVIEALAKKLRDGEHPVVATEHVHNWIDYILGQHALWGDYRLDTIYRRYVAAIFVDPTIGLAAFQRRTKALWQMLVANQKQAKKAGRRKGSLLAKNRPELQQLGVYRMAEVFGLSIEECINRIIDQLGDDAYYTDPRSVQRAIAQTKERLRKFFQPPDLNTE